MSTQAEDGMCYPPPEATHEQVFADAAVFQRTLERLHQRLGIKVKVPRVNGVEVDLHLLYKEVTKLGGLQPVIARKQWVLVCDPFNFPQSFTNRSFVIKKLYITALHHYEQLYFHRRQGALVPCNADGEKHAAHTPKRKEPEGSHLAAIIPEPGSPALPQDLPDGTHISGTIEASVDGGYSITLDLPGRRLQAVIYNNGAANALAIPSQLARLRTDSPSRANQAKSPRLGAVSSPLAPPRPARPAFQFFELGVDKEQVLQLHSSTGSPANIDQLPQMISDLWCQMTSEQRQPFVEMAVKDRERHDREYQEYQQRVRVNSTVQVHTSSPCSPASRLHSTPASTSRAAAGPKPPYDRATSPLRPLQYQGQYNSHGAQSHMQPMVPAREAHYSPYASTSPYPGRRLSTVSAGDAAAVSGAFDQQYLSALVMDDPSDALALAMDVLEDNDNDALIDFFGCSTHIQVHAPGAGAMKPEVKVEHSPPAPARDMGSQSGHDASSTVKIEGGRPI